MPGFTPAHLSFGRALHSAVALFYRSIKETGTKPALESITRDFTISWEREAGGQRLLFKGNTSVNSHLDLGQVLKKFYEEIQPRKVEAVECPFAVPVVNPTTGEQLDASLVGVVDLIGMD